MPTAETDPPMVPVTIGTFMTRRPERAEAGEEEGTGPAEDQVDREDHWMRLTETGGGRDLTISIGKAEAASLAFTLQGTVFGRPMTYQFAAALLRGAGPELSEVRITRLDDGVFYAEAELSNGAVIDARPSDAVNLAALTGAPVLVASDLLDLPLPPSDIASGT